MSLRGLFGGRTAQSQALCIGDFRCIYDVDDSSGRLTSAPQQKTDAICSSYPDIVLPESHQAGHDTSSKNHDARQHVSRSKSMPKRADHDAGSKTMSGRPSHTSGKASLKSLLSHLRPGTQELDDSADNHPEASGKQVLSDFLKNDLTFQQVQFLAERDDGHARSKERCLTRLKTLFKNTSSSIVLVFYIGDADERGNWRLGGPGSETVLGFRELSMLWQNSRKHSQHLVLLLDCPNSCYWVQAVKQLSKAEQLELSLCVQASDSVPSRVQQQMLHPPGAFTRRFIQNNALLAKGAPQSQLEWPMGMHPSSYSTWLCSSLMDFGMSLSFFDASSTPQDASPADSKARHVPGAATSPYRRYSAYEIPYATESVSRPTTLECMPEDDGHEVPLSPRSPRPKANGEPSLQRLSAGSMQSNKASGNEWGSRLVVQQSSYSASNGAGRMAFDAELANLLEKERHNQRRKSRFELGGEEGIDRILNEGLSTDNLDDSHYDLMAALPQGSPKANPEGESTLFVVGDSSPPMGTPAVTPPTSGGRAALQAPMNSVASSARNSASSLIPVHLHLHQLEVASTPHVHEAGPFSSRLSRMTTNEQATPHGPNSGATSARNNTPQRTLSGQLQEDGAGEEEGEGEEDSGDNVPAPALCPRSPSRSSFLSGSVSKYARAAITAAAQSALSSPMSPGDASSPGGTPPGVSPSDYSNPHLRFIMRPSPAPGMESEPPSPAESTLLPTRGGRGRFEIGGSETSSFIFNDDEDRYAMLKELQARNADVDGMDGMHGMDGMEDGDAEGGYRQDDSLELMRPAHAEAAAAAAASHGSNVQPPLPGVPGIDSDAHAEMLADMQGEGMLVLGGASSMLTSDIIPSPARQPMEHMPQQPEGVEEACEEMGGMHIHMA